jgi:hypothetical protein
MTTVMNTDNEKLGVRQAGTSYSEITKLPIYNGLLNGST